MQKLHQKFIKIADKEFYPNEEFWLINGELINVGSFPGTHRGYVIQHILDKYNIKSLTKYTNRDWSEEDHEIVEKNLTDDELDAVYNIISPSDYAVNTLGWIRISFGSLHLPNLNSTTLQQVSDALLEIYGNQIYNAKLYVITPSGSHANVPFKNLQYGAQAVKQSEYMYAKNNNKFIKISQAVNIPTPSHIWEQYFIINGNPVNVGDLTHTHNEFVMNYILQKNNISNSEEFTSRINSWGEIENIEDLKPLLKNLSADELEVLTGKKDPSDYAVNDLGWIRISSSTLHLPNISPLVLWQTAQALLKIYGNEIRKFNKFYIVIKNADFNDISFEMLESGSTKEISEAKSYLYARRKKRMKR